MPHAHTYLLIQECDLVILKPKSATSLGIDA